MSRPLRIEFSGALYHVMARGNAREAIFQGDGDRQMFYSGLARVCQRFEWRLWAYCLMDNYHPLLVETLQPTLVPKPLAQYEREAAHRNTAIEAAFARGAYIP